MSSASRAVHTAFTSLPIVDMQLLYSDSLADRQAVAKNIDEATRAAGFFYLKGHGINPQLMTDLIQNTRAYFAQHTSVKMADYIGQSNNHSGYVPQLEEEFYSSASEPAETPNSPVITDVPDLKEAYDIGPENSSLMARFCDDGSNQWPKQMSDGGAEFSPSEFKRAVSQYYTAMLNLSKTLFEGFALALGLPEHYFTQHLTSPPSQLRLVHYFHNENAKETDSGIGAHTDYEFFTLLLPTSPGLQALNGAGQWINIPVVEDCFVVNIGDMMEVVTCGHYMATSHRVRQVKQERYSFPFFASLDYQTSVAPIAELSIDSAMSTEVKHIICGDHLLAQTAQTFRYLKRRVAQGEIYLPSDAKGLSSFGHLAKQRS